MTINQLTEMRRNGLQALIDNGWLVGFKRLLTDLYPDNAHFIYELLQNAEDAKASEVRFTLNTDRVEFEHDGTELFTIEDVESITNIGSSTKADDPTNIGKFGVGFKAVFAYTANPEIESDLFHFRIREMVVPESISPGSLGDRKTHFVFPFDNPEKPPEKAQAEIEKHLRELNENTLLFLSNIRKIEYRLPDATEGFLERREIADDEHRIEIAVMRQGRPVPESVHYLRFEKVVSVRDETDGKSEDYRIAVAFGLEPQDRGWKIAPLYPGQVCIYFPAVKETSNLRFHLHAPFASTVARDSVRDYPANNELRNHLAELVAESMHVLRDRDLLNVEFLAVLPNSRDNLSPFYLPIQERLIQEFNQEKLTPMKRGGHAAALTCYRGRRNLSDLINDEDLAMLLGEDPALPLWIANPPQINQPEDNFLSMLGIHEWKIENLIEELQSPADSVMEWLNGKSDEWHQALYVLLGEYLSSAPSYSLYFSEERKTKLSNLRIVRCSDGEYRIGSECHFPGDDREPDEILSSAAIVLEEESQSVTQEDEREEDFNYVAREVYSSGRNGAREKSREFLEKIGVRKIDESERIKVVLKQRYTKPFKPRTEDMPRFLAFFEDEPNKVSLFKDYPIFKIDKDFDNKSWWSRPRGVFLDSPYLGTGLSVYYDALSDDITSRKWALSPAYMESGVDPEALGKFAKAVGAQTKLMAVKQEIPLDHPEWENNLRRAPGSIFTDTGINEDYGIPALQTWLNSSSIVKSKLVWLMMCSLPERCLKARFRWNQSNPGIREAHSSLVYDLRNANWIPQKDGDAISFVQPCDASREHLPEKGFPWPQGHPHDAGEKWLDSIEFGKAANAQKAENIHRDQQAKNLGFDSADEAKKHAEFASRLKEQGISIDNVISQYRPPNSETPDFPEQPVRDRPRRARRVRERFREAAPIAYEPKERNIRTSQDSINQKTSLIGWYTNESGEMLCQICQQEMPFKKDDGNYYFEAVEVLDVKFLNQHLSEHHVPKELEAQYLALCPTCAAMYKYFVKGSPETLDALTNQWMNSENLETPVQLGERETSIRFVEAHLHDLKVILAEYTPEDSTD